MLNSHLEFSEPVYSTAIEFTNFISGDTFVQTKLSLYFFTATGTRVLVSDTNCFLTFEIHGCNRLIHCTMLDNVQEKWHLAKSDFRGSSRIRSTAIIYYFEHAILNEVLCQIYRCNLKEPVLNFICGQKRPLVCHKSKHKLNCKHDTLLRFSSFLFLFLKRSDCITKGS